MEPVSPTVPIGAVSVSVQDMLDALNEAEPGDANALEEVIMMLSMNYVDHYAFATCGGVQALQHWMQSDYLTNVEKATEAMEVVSGHANTRDVIISCGIVDDVLRLLVDPELEESARKAANSTLKNLAGRARNPQRLQPAASYTPKADPATPPVWATHEPGSLEWRIEAASALADIMLCEYGRSELTEPAAFCLRQLINTSDTKSTARIHGRDLDALLPIITEAESVAAQVAAIKAVTCCAALQSHARKSKHSPNGALLNVLVRTLKEPQPRAGLVTKPAPTAVMAAWSLGYWARKGVGHADAVLFAGGADALVTMLKSNARHHRDGAVYALAGLMDRNVDAVRHAFAHSQGVLALLAGLKGSDTSGTERDLLKLCLQILQHLLDTEDDEAGGQQDLLVTEVVVSDGIAVLVNYARAKQQEISDASIVCLQCIARADKRYRTAIRALTHDKALDERIFPGFKHNLLSRFGLRKAPSKGPVDKGIMRSVTATPSPLSGAIPHKRLSPSVSMSLAQSSTPRNSTSYGSQAGSHYTHQPSSPTGSLASTTAFSTQRPYHLQHDSETLSRVSEMPGLERASSTSASSERRPITPAQVAVPARPPRDSSSQPTTASSSPEATPRATDTDQEYLLNGVRVLPFVSTNGGRHYPIQAGPSAAPADPYRSSATSGTISHTHPFHAHEPASQEADLALSKASINGLRSPRGTPTSHQDQSSSFGRSQSNDSSSSRPPGSNGSAPVPTPSPPRSFRSRKQPNGISGPVGNNQEPDDGEIPVSFPAQPVAPSPDKHGAFQQAMSQNVSQAQDPDVRNRLQPALTGSNHSSQQR
ncbi:hypothetical protein WJX74_006833 [Apatococcus lobatus]|uniref:Uncharacterized protein n=1 Tax=Apatococcus lobatus TaxID=904363 RepID=A0AAW1RSG5_9CHLO